MCKKLVYLTSFVLVLFLASNAFSVDDPSDMADSSGDIKRIEAWVEDGNLNLTMTVYGVFAPEVQDTPAGMTNRYYYHWLLDTDTDPATGYNNSGYEGNATNVKTPIGVDLVVQFGWRDGATNGVYAYDPLTEVSLFEDYEYTIDGDTIHAVIPLEDLGLEPGQTIAVSAFQEGASNDWQVDWLESFELTLTAIEKTVLFAEDFESVVLGPNVDEALAGDAVWTDTPPEGWSVDESGIPGINMDATDGVTEWAGWAFTDKTWWVQAAEDQDRSLFELGSGTVAVADPDEWDDAERLPIPISADPYDTWLTTPEIKIEDAVAGTLELKFDSSWRPEFDDNYHQTANITASFDGGDPIEVMLWESDEASPNYHPYATNETVIVKLDKPEGAKKVVLTFGLFDAGNDWWWAIDNIEVRGVVPSVDPVDPGIEGLAAYYPFENDVLDASGNGNDGTIVGDPVFVEGPVGYGMAMEFNGDDYIDCGNGDSLQIQDEITISFWFNVVVFENTWEGFLAKGDNSYRASRGGGTGDATHMGISGTTAGGGNGWFNGVTLITGGDWHHFVGTYDGAEAKIYIDGVLDVTTEATGQINISEYNLYIGENSQATGRFLHGILDEVMIYSRALSEAEIRYLAGERARPVDPGTDGLVAYYEFENNADDSSGNEIHGTLVGDAGFAEGPEGYGMALSLDGDGDYVDCGLNPLLDITEEITFTYWIKVVALDRSWNTVLSRGDDSWRSSRAGENNFMEAAVGGTSGNYLYGVTPVDDDKWHHFGAVYDGDTFTLYLDGEKESSEESTGLITASTYPLLIGENAQATGRFWNGLIDEVVIYDRALSTGEIRYLAGFRAMDNPGTDALIAAYPFENDVLDGSGNGNDATVNGDPAFVEGLVGMALEFDGDGDFLDCGANPILALTDAVSISAWIKVAVAGADHKVGGNQDGANGGYKMSVYGDKIEFEIRTAGNSAVLNRSVAGGTIIEVDTWYHVVGVYSLEDGYIRTYVDGELDRELLTTQALGASPGSLMIGCEPFNTGSYNFNGIMDEVQVYNKALTAAEARYLANN
jgi:hypothetical protein